MNDYEDIINLPYPYPSSHRKMLQSNRAAQFAPFAALVGFEEAIAQASQVFEERKLLDDSQKEEINRQIIFLKTHSSDKIRARVCYFQKLSSEDKGQTFVYEGTFSKVKENYLLFLPKKKIFFEDIYEIQIVDSKK